MRTKLALGTGALLLVIGGAGTAVAANDDGDANVIGPQADRARAAALQATGGGTANSVERDSEDGATWEVEVTRPDGSTVDVRLDSRFAVVVIDGDSDTSEGGSSG